MLGAFEIQILQFFEGLRSDLLNTVFEAITMISEEMLMIVLIAFLWFAADKRLAQKVLYVSLASMSLNGIIKNFARVPRPFATGQVSCVRMDTATGYSFPSAHTQAFATWSSVAAKNLKKAWLWRLVGTVIVLVGFSRIFLGAHYPSDVVVGALLGVACAFFGDWLFEKVKNTNRLYLLTILAVTPFVVLFFFWADPQFEDLFKFYGMMIAMVASVWVDQRWVKLSTRVPWWKTALRMALAAVFAVLAKLLLGAIPAGDSVHAMLILEAVVHFGMVFAGLGLCPCLIKVLKI